MPLDSRPLLDHENLDANRASIELLSKDVSVVPTTRTRTRTKHEHEHAHAHEWRRR
jgi:hypothetical protein